MKITVAGLAGGEDSLSAGLLKRFKEAKRIVLQTGRTGEAAHIRKQGIRFETLDALYDAASDSNAFNAAAAAFICGAGVDTLFCVPGAPWENAAVLHLVQKARQGAVQIEAIPGAGHADRALCAALAYFPPAFQGVVAAPAARVEGIRSDTDAVLCVTGMDTRGYAGQVKTSLAPLYGDEKEIVLCAGGMARTARLSELDRQPEYGGDTAVVIFPCGLQGKKRYTFHDLVRIMTFLRGENGCPWDKVQTHASLKPYLVEEAYEVLEAVDEGDPGRLADELGDVLLQVVFHAEIARQSGAFGMEDVTTAVCEKLIGRHTHIFGKDVANTAGEVARNWEAVKRREKGFDTVSQSIRDIPKGMPALMRSYKVQKKAAQIGFDWERPQGALEKIREEAEELLRETQKKVDSRRTAEEAGDLLFAVVNLCRMLGVEPETALAGATDKFFRRFAYMENAALDHGSGLKNMNLQQLDALWNEAKQKGL